jgi:hypothetical protein
MKINLTEEQKIHIGGMTIGILLLYFSIKRKSIIYFGTGLLWFLANAMLFKYEKYVVNLINNKVLFSILFMAIPAFIMGLLVLYESYKYNDVLIKIIISIVIIVDIFHLYQSSPIILFIILIVLLLIRLYNPVHYDDITPLIPINKTYLKKSDILFVIPKYNNKPITDYPDFIKYLKKYSNDNNKIIGLHGYTDNPEGYFTTSEYGKELSDEYIKENIDLFTKAFGFKPTIFKAPCYNLHPVNKKILEKHGLKISEVTSLLFNKLFHNDNSKILTFFNKLNLFI